MARGTPPPIPETTQEGKSESEDKDEEPKRTKRELGLLSENEKKFDPDATKEDCINDLRLLQEHN